MGVGNERRTIRLARVNHNLRRLVCISDDGFVTLSALKWLSDIGASPVMLDRIGKVGFGTGPTAPSDARLRLAQARALSNGTALAISKELISAKLRGQETLVRDKLKNSAAADAITGFRVRLDNADNSDSVRTLEAHAAIAHWNAWRDVPLLWPRSDLSRVPDHWRTFGTRASPLTGGPRLAVNPASALLNFIFAVCEPQNQSASAVDAAKRFKLIQRIVQSATLIATKRLAEVSRAGRVAGHTPEAIAKEAATHRKHAQAKAAWNPAKQPS
jgi:hypothetical protein